MTIDYSRGCNTFDVTPEQRQAHDFAAFAAAVLADRGAIKGQQYIAGPVGPAAAGTLSGRRLVDVSGKPHRTAQCALPCRFLALDIDGVDEPGTWSSLCAFVSRWSAIAYETASSIPCAPRGRVIVELDVPLGRSERIAVSAALRGEIDRELGADRIKWDAALDRPEQPVFLPTVGAWATVYDGDPLRTAQLVLAPSRAPVSGPSVSGRIAPLTAAELRDLRSALDVLDSDDRANWIAVGHDLHELGDQGLALWQAWSQRSPKWQPADAGRWATFSASRSGWRNVLARAQAAGWVNPGGGDHAQPAPRQLLVPVPLDDLMTSAPPPVRFVVEPIIPRRVATLLSAHGGSGKSVLALTIAAHVAAGRPWAGLSVVQGKAVFVSLEDPGDLVRFRLRRIIEACALPDDAVLDALTVLDGSDLSSGLMHESFRDSVRLLVDSDAMDSLRAAAKGASLIVVDNASDAADFDENVRRYVRQFVRGLAKVARDNDAGLILLAHIDKAAARFGANGESYSGSTAWHNSVRSRLALIGKAGAIELVHEKANLSRPADPRLFTWTDAGVLVPTTAEAAQAGAQARDAILANDDAEHIACAVQAAHAAGVTVPAAMAGPKTARHILESFPELPEHLSGKANVDRFKRALIHAVRQSMVEEQDYQDDYRNRRRRIVPVGLAAVNPPYTPCEQPQQAADAAAVRVSRDKQRTDAQLTQTAAAPVAPVVRQQECDLPAQPARPIQPPAWAIDPKEAA